LNFGLNRVWDEGDERNSFLSFSFVFLIVSVSVSVSFLFFLSQLTVLIREEKRREEKRREEKRREKRREESHTTKLNKN